MKRTTKKKGNPKRDTDEYIKTTKSLTKIFEKLIKDYTDAKESPELVNNFRIMILEDRQIMKYWKKILEKIPSENIYQFMVGFIKSDENKLKFIIDYSNKLPNDYDQVSIEDEIRKFVRREKIYFLSDLKTMRVKKDNITTYLDKNGSTSEISTEIERIKLITNSIITKPKLKKESYKLLKIINIQNEQIIKKNKDFIDKVSEKIINKMIEVNTETGVINVKNPVYLNFPRARKYVRDNFKGEEIPQNELDSKLKWFEWSKKADLPEDIPKNPEVVYSKRWISYNNWLLYTDSSVFLKRRDRLIRDKKSIKRIEVDEVDGVEVIEVVDRVDGVEVVEVVEKADKYIKINKPKEQQIKELLFTLVYSDINIDIIEVKKSDNIQVILLKQTRKFLSEKLTKTSPEIVDYKEDSDFMKILILTAYNESKNLGNFLYKICSIVVFLDEESAKTFKQNLRIEMYDPAQLLELKFKDKWPEIQIDRVDIELVAIKQKIQKNVKNRINFLLDTVWTGSIKTRPIHSWILKEEKCSKIKSPTNCISNGCSLEKNRYGFDVCQENITDSSKRSKEYRQDIIDQLNILGHNKTYDDWSTEDLEKFLKSILDKDILKNKVTEFLIKDFESLLQDEINDINSSDSSPYNIHIHEDDEDDEDDEEYEDDDEDDDEDDEEYEEDDLPQDLIITKKTCFYCHRLVLNYNWKSIYEISDGKYKDIYFCGPECFTESYWTKKSGNSKKNGRVGPTDR
jgi:hypothetical protein